MLILFIHKIALKSHWYSCDAWFLNIYGIKSFPDPNLHGKSWFLFLWDVLLFGIIGCICGMCVCISSYICVCVCTWWYIYSYSHCSFFFFFATPHGMWILVPQPRIESIPPALETQNLNHWTIRKCPPVYTRSLWKFWWVSLSDKIHLGQFGNPDFFPPDIKNLYIHDDSFY